MIECLNLQVETTIQQAIEPKTLSIAGHFLHSNEFKDLSVPQGLQMKKDQTINSQFPTLQTSCFFEKYKYNF